MNNQDKQTVLFEIPNAKLHLFINDEKNIIATSHARISQIETGENNQFYLSANNFDWKLSNDQVVARLLPKDNDFFITYIFINPTFNGIYTLTLENTPETIPEFEAALSKSTFLLDFSSAMQNQQFSEVVNQHCPYIEHQTLADLDKCQFGIKWTGKMIAGGFRFIGFVIAQGVTFIGNQIHKRVSEPENKPEVPLETKTKWNKIKSGTSAAASLSVDLYSSYIEPVAQKGISYGKKIGNKMENSENSKVRYAKELMACTGEALLTVGKGVIEGTKEIGGEIGTQTKRIVDKKYGNDYVNTFLRNAELEEERKNEAIAPYFGESQVHEQLLYPNLNTDEETSKNNKTPGY